MRIDAQLSDAALLGELGRRIAQTRLERNVAQSELATEAGVALSTVQRLEAGRSVAATSLIRILRALDLLGGLERAVPEPLPSPVELLKLQGRRRRRAGRPRVSGASPETREPWRWGDEEAEA